MKEDINYGRTMNSAAIVLQKSGKFPQAIELYKRFL
jgi:hypothetical protein